MENELKKEAWALLQIFMNAQESYKAVLELSKQEEDKNRAFVKSNNAFLQFTKIICWRNTVTELSKLFWARCSEHYNLFHFIKKLKENKFPESQINEAMIASWEASLEKESAAILNIVEQRDKIYAHTDRNGDKVVNVVTLSKTEELLTIVFDIIHDIYSSCFDSGLVRYPTGSPVDDLDRIIEALALRDKYYEGFENGMISQ